MKISLDKILLFLIIFFLAISVLICVIRQKYEISVALAGIFSSIFIPFFTKNLEIEKHQKQFLYEKKYNAYVKYLNIIDEYYRQAQETILLISGFKGENFKNKEDFETYKEILITSYKQFSELCSRLTMPGLETLIFIQEDVERKIREIVEFGTNENLTLNSECDYFENAKKIQKYINVLADIAGSLKNDLKIGAIK